MKISRSKITEPEVVTVIAKGTTFNGTIESDQTVQIEGKFNGDIDLTGKLITTSTSSIQGNIRATEIFIGGKAKGDLYGTESITIQETGKVEATIKTDSIIIEKGGVFEGDCLMNYKETELIEMEPKLLEKQA